VIPLPDQADEVFGTHRQAYSGTLCRGGLPLLARSRAKGIGPPTFRRNGDFALFP
jgi:hypothetical protein